MFPLNLFPNLPILTAHSVDHLCRQFHRWRHRLGIAAQNVAKIYMEHLAVLAQQQIVHVTVADPQHIAYHRIAGTRPHIILNHVRLDAVRTRRRRTIDFEVLLEK